MKLNSALLPTTVHALLLIMTPLATSSPAFSDDSNTVRGASAEAIYKALRISEDSGPMESPGGHPFKKFFTTKTIGGLTCRCREDINVNIPPDLYSCTLSRLFQAADIYNALGVPTTPLAPGSCSPSTDTKSVGGLTCERTLGETLGSGLTYSCTLSVTLNST